SRGLTGGLETKQRCHLVPSFIDVNSRIKPKRLTVKLPRRVGSAHERAPLPPDRGLDARRAGAGTRARRRPEAAPQIRRGTPPPARPAARHGVRQAVDAHPRGYEPPEGAIDAARERGQIELVRDAREAAADAHVLYTDTWISMGQENERVQRLRDLQGYAIDDDLLSRAADDAIVMH